MKCPFCSNNETCVIETRETDEDTTRRRRECLKCRKRFTTYERPELFNIRVIKKDGNLEAFDKEKILRGVLKACEKRPVGNEAMESLVDDVERTIRNKHPKEVKSTVIGDLVVNRLKKLDHVAYIRFASVYRAFADVSDLQEEIKRLVNTKPKARKKVIKKNNISSKNDKINNKGLKTKKRLAGI